MKQLSFFLMTAALIVGCSKSEAPSGGTPADSDRAHTAIRPLRDLFHARFVAAPWSSPSSDRRPAHF